MNVKYIKTINNGVAEQKLYYSEKPIQIQSNSFMEFTNYILVSKVNNAYAHETMIFPSNSLGAVTDYLDLGRLTGEHSHEETLIANGFVIETDSQ
jgi:hypothetical protein